jgi:hypothetical protein
MVTGELKNKVDGLWEIFWTGGLTNPLDVIEQMTYLMFIRDLDDSDNVHMKESIMLGLPYKSIFEENVTIGDRKSSGESAQVERISRFSGSENVCKYAGKCVPVYQKSSWR